jgi:hypothetical protein
MGSFLNKLTDQQRHFFNDYLWRVNKSSNSTDGDSLKGKENRDKSQSVRPFIINSKKYYWEKAYLEYIKYQTIQDKAAIAAEKTMNIVYTVGNTFNSVAPAIYQVAQAIPIVGISWNLIDAGGACVLAARDKKKYDNWSAGINILSSIQLIAGTVSFTLLNYSEGLHIGISTSAGVSAIAAGASGFAFAAAMFFSWALEHREVKLHRVRIDYLKEKIQELEEDLKNNCDYMPDPDEQKKINDLKNFINANPNDPPSKKFQNLLELIQFKQHQQQQLGAHERARRVWGLCAIFMTAMAIVSVVIIALGVSTSTCGIALVAASSLIALLGSALYRHKPEAFDNAVNNIYNFFKPKQTNYPASANKTEQTQQVVPCPFGL